MKSDESAFSIVPSHLSSRVSMSTGQTGNRNSIDSYASMVYRPLSFENDLFTARVYKKNNPSPPLKRHWKKERNHVDGDNETITLQENRHQKNESVAEQKSQRATSYKGTTICEIAEQVADPQIHAIKVTHDVDIHHYNNPHYVPHYGDSPKPATESFADLLEACGKGDHDSVRRLLGMKPEAELRILRYLPC